MSAGCTVRDLECSVNVQEFVVFAAAAMIYDGRAAAAAAARSGRRAPINKQIQRGA
jgi:hypothetical protein